MYHGPLIHQVEKVSILHIHCPQVGNLVGEGKVQLHNSTISN